MSWEINLHPEAEGWYLQLCKADPESADLIKDAIDQLAEDGPTARRPPVDRVQSSRYHHMKELRPLRPRPGNRSSCSPTTSLRLEPLVSRGDTAGR